MERNRFSATAAGLGYAYQFRAALWLALRRHQTGLRWAVAIETADDLQFSGEGDDQLVQLKHRKAGTALTDVSPDLWKSIRVWSEGIARGSIQPTEMELILVTTGEASPGSICLELSERSERRDNHSLAARLSAIASDSRNVVLKKAMAAYLALDLQTRQEVTAAITVFHNAPTIEDLDERIRSLARLMARSEHLDAFLERLEGWWIRRCLSQMVGRVDRAATGDEFDAFLTELREAFHADNLPIDDEAADANPVVDAFLDRRFCRQLDLFGLGTPRIAIAVRDFHRAFVQRSRWSHDGLLEYGELSRYERRLSEAWELEFERLRDELGEGASEERMRAFAKEIYRWAERADYPIRSACTEGFVCRGSLHMLADECVIGWHPEFEMRLAAVMEEAHLDP